MKHIREYRSFDDPVFDFDQTLHVVNKGTISERCECLDCGCIWESFNKSTLECKECGSENIKVSEGDDTGDQYVDLYNLDKKYESMESGTYDEAISEVKSMIESTIENSGGEFSSFIESYKKDPSSVKIEGLINDSDIYDFYLKYRNDVDEVLNDIKFYDEVPSENSVFGLYDYIISGTNRSISEFVNKI